MQLLFQFVQKVEGVLSLTVHLVDEDNERRFAHTADRHQFPGLRLHAFRTVHDDDGAVHRCQRAERIFGKVLMARGVQDIHFVIPVVEFHDGSRDRNTALFFDFHPVAGGRFLDFVVLDGSGHLDLPAEEQ